MITDRFGSSETIQQRIERKIENPVSGKSDVYGLLSNARSLVYSTPMSIQAYNGEKDFNIESMNKWTPTIKGHEKQVINDLAAMTVMRSNALDTRVMYGHRLPTQQEIQKLPAFMKKDLPDYKQFS